MEKNLLPFEKIQRTTLIKRKDATTSNGHGYRLLIVALILAGVFIISGCTKERQVIDNRILENVETKDVSCEDIGCLEGQTCKNHQCVDQICSSDYNCCSNTDCDDDNSDTQDKCENPSTINSNCKHMDIVKKCNDGTSYNKCSEFKPAYCSNGELVNDCNLCGCPPDKNNCLKNNICSKFSENADCENKNYKMAFILLVKNPEDVTPEVLNKLSEIKKAFPEYFYTATKNKAQIDIDHDTYTIHSKASMFDVSHGQNANYVISGEVTKEFYETNDDIYDFLTIYTTFSTERYSTHDLVVNNIKGIGYPVTDYSNIYGSKGKLKGINFLRMLESDLTIEMNKLLHETGHQWCCYVGDNFNEGQNGAKLEIIQQGIHFYRGLQSPYETGDPMNSDYWISNGDGTFKRENSQGIGKYHPFQLYFMGLLPEEEYDNKFQVYKYGPVNFEFEKAVPYKEVSVNDIIEVEGKRDCVLE